jgi:hypothetical protein
MMRNRCGDIEVLHRAMGMGDERERDLRAENERLRAVLRGLLEVLPSLWTDKRIADKCDEARRALEGK